MISIKNFDIVSEEPVTDIQAGWDMLSSGNEEDNDNIIK